VRALVDKGDRVFLDLKFRHSEYSCAGCCRRHLLGVWMVNVHAAGGREMMAAARRRRKKPPLGSRPAPLVIAVTVLTSMTADALAETGA
jgi:orotidine-5'-phosphate decarboxylase